MHVCGKCNLADLSRNNHMQKYIDAHCHLLNAPDIDLAISNSRAMGVVAYIVAPATPAQWDDVVDLTDRFDFIYGAVGIHPWNVSELPQNYSAKLEKILVKNPRLMVGEIGLDKNHPDMARQMAVFIEQLRLAHKLSRGVHLHCVGCWDAVTRILAENKNTLPTFILAHGFNGNANDIEKMAAAYNMFFSYGPRNLRQKLGACRISKTPLSRILVESDGADSTVIPSIVSHISEILGMENDILSDIIYENTKQIL